MDVLRTYVIRIYRQSPGALAGMIEAVDSGEITAFHSVEELCAAVLHPASRGRAYPDNVMDKENDR